MNESSGLIQGGRRSQNDQFPWTVAIFVKVDLDVYEHKAVGTLISQQHVVSLANPFSYIDDANRVRPISGDRLKLYFGINKLSESFVTGVLIIDGALKIVLHPNFKPESPRSADVAIIFLQSPIYLTHLISPACLWSQDNNSRNLVGQIGYAVGWGINESGEYSEYKKHAALKVLDQNVCRKFYAQYLDISRYFCTAAKDASPCEFDDPFYIKVNGRWLFRGLVTSYYFSLNENKCDLQTPVLYEDLAPFSEWIQSLMKY